MSFQASTWAISQRDVPSRPKLVLMALANHASHIDGRSWPSIETIADEAACSRRAVFGYIAALERNGYIEVQRTRKRSGRQGPNNYWLIFDRQPSPWSYLIENADPEPPIAPEDAELVEQAVEENSPLDTSPGVQSANLHSGEPVENPPPECKAAAPGQSATVCTRQESSDLKQSDSRTVTPARERAPLRTSGPPLGYRPQARFEQAEAPQAADEGKPKPIFVWEGVDAWKAWKAHKERILRKPWNLITTHEGKRGWWFPTLYPPRATGPPPNSLMTPADEAELARGI